MVMEGCLVDHAQELRWKKSASGMKRREKVVWICKEEALPVVGVESHAKES